MLDVAEQLIELQKVDNRVAELEKKVSGIPEFLQKSKDELDKVTEDYEKLKTKYESESRTLNTLKGHAEDNKALLEKAQKKLPEVKNHKEYEAVLKEMDVLKKTINESEYKALELDESVTSDKEELDKLKEQKETLEKEFKEKQAQKKEEDSEFSTELEEKLKEREDLASKVKRSVLSKYERVRNARDNLAIVRTIDETCTGCYIKVPPQLYVDVRKEEQLLQCPHCQRFLYYKDDEE
ncbi:zinc ribbon domain-containing protein [Limisalsivibrio acetivorans]|uniref:zinc ribbon domain-containing protein n=1 Tax=Limisalsivibrio acetivorans TaxID=1304888 RepID=UPI0003B4AFCE|nr:C4-type zinc ribbon domain-containing protein [Limisalsivibrio acetivorans]